MASISRRYSHRKFEFVTTKIYTEIPNFCIPDFFKISSKPMVFHIIFKNLIISLKAARCHAK